MLSLLLKQSGQVIHLVIALCLNVFHMFSVHVNMLIILSFCRLLTIATYTLMIKILLLANSFFVLLNDCLIY